jgi:hypothetical protein
MATTNSIARDRAMLRRALTLLVSFAVAACGGGGEGRETPPRLSAPSAPVSVTGPNSEAVTAIAVEAAIGMMGSSALQQVPLGVAVEGDAPPATHVVSRITSQTLRRVVAARSAPSVTGAVQSEPCYVSGSITISGSETSGRITFNQCSDTEGLVINGWFSMTDFSATGDEYTGSVSVTVWMDLSVTASGMTMRTAGDYVVRASWTPTSDTVQMSGGSLGYTDGITTVVLLNFTLSESTDWSYFLVTSSSDFTLASTELGGAVTVHTVTPFVTDFSCVYPHEGVIVVTGAGGTKVRITVYGNEYYLASAQLTIEVDANGDGFYETLTPLDWADLP